MITQALGIKNDWELIKGIWSQNAFHPPMIVVMVVFVHFNIE
jgi:hypothetical protein